jgi:hypothetical protein
VRTSRDVVRTKATELDIYVNGERVGWVVDCGDCWRAAIFNKSGTGRGRHVFPDYGSRREAVRGVVEACAGRS